MMTRPLRSLLLLAAAAAPAAAAPHVLLTYETGPAYVAQNDGRYGAGGTSYQADDVAQQDNLVRGERSAVELVLGRHRVIALYAPFQLDTQVALVEPLVFRATTFDAGTVVDHRYRFDGYRASYLYQLRGGRLALELGGSLQVRDANVAFTSADGAQRDQQTNIGLVPALKVRATYTTGCAWGQLEADGLSTFGLAGDTSGGLYDVALAAGLPVHRDVDVYANLRWLGGGAEVPTQQIDNWANFVSASLGVRVALGR